MVLQFYVIQHNFLLFFDNIFFLVKKIEFALINYNKITLNNNMNDIWIIVKNNNKIIQLCDVKDIWDIIDTYNCKYTLEDYIEYILKCSTLHISLNNGTRIKKAIYYLLLNRDLFKNMLLKKSILNLLSNNESIKDLILSNINKYCETVEFKNIYSVKLFNNYINNITLAINKYVKCSHLFDETCYHLYDGNYIVFIINYE